MRVGKRARAAHHKGHHFLERELFRAEEQEVEVRKRVDVNALLETRTSEMQVSDRYRTTPSLPSSQQVADCNRPIFLAWAYSRFHALAFGKRPSQEVNHLTLVGYSAMREPDTEVAENGRTPECQTIKEPLA